MDLPNSRISVNFDARPADDFARLVMPPLPATNQFCTNEISELFTSSSVHVILTLTITIIIIIIITILKLDFVHAAQNYAHKLSLASQRADSHGHILSKSSTNLEKWGGVQKKVSLSHRMVHLPVNDFMRTSFDFSIASSLNQRRIRVCCRIAAQIYLSPYPNFL